MLNLLFEDCQAKIVSDHIFVFSGVHQSLVRRDGALLARNILVEQNGNVRIIGRIIFRRGSLKTNPLGR